MSAQSLLAGLFPPNSDELWNGNLMWQPIPVHTAPRDMDYVLNAKDSCPRYDKALKLYEASPEHQALFEKYKELFEYLEEHTGMPIRTLDDVYKINNTLWIQSINNKA